MSDDIKYPLRIRFWYWLYDTAERLSDWTHREKIKPWHDAYKLPLIPPKYHLLNAIDPTPDERKRGITATKIYVSDKSWPNGPTTKTPTNGEQGHTWK